jgi:hypothetical protein
MAFAAEADPLPCFTSGWAHDGVAISDHSGLGPFRKSRSQHREEIAARDCRTNPSSSGPKSDNVDMTVPSNYSAAPSGDLCTTSKRFFGSVGWENRKSVRTRADRPQLLRSVRRSTPETGTPVGLPWLAELTSNEIEILSATRDELKRGGLHAGESPCRMVFHPWKRQARAAGWRMAVASVAPASVAGSSVPGSSVTRHRHRSGPPRNSFFT